MLFPALLLAGIAASADLQSGKYEWVFKLEDRTQRVACNIEVTGDSFVLRAGNKDPLQGKVNKQDVTFEIDNDANFMRGSGKLDKDGWVRGEMAWGQGGRTLAKGTFVFAPINTREQVAALEAYFKAERPKLEIPAKKSQLLSKTYEAKELRDTLGRFMVSVPPLGGEMKFTEEDASPVTRLFRFDFESGDVAVLVSTKMRDDRPKDESALLRLEPRAKASQEQFGADVMQYQLLGEAPNRVLQMTLLNSAESPFFPLSIAHMSSKTLDNVSVQQMFIKSDRMFEFAILANNSNAEDEEKLLARITNLCTKWRATIVVK
jgi:hypothetical protein